MIFPEPGSVRLTPEQRLHLVSLLDTWVQTHPEPDSPEFLVMGRDYSPREVLVEVAAATEFGDHLGGFLYWAAEAYHTSVEDMIGRAILANREAREAQ